MATDVHFIAGSWAGHIRTYEGPLGTQLRVHKRPGDTNMELPLEPDAPPVEDFPVELYALTCFHSELTGRNVVVAYPWGSDFTTALEGLLLSQAEQVA